MSWRNATLPAVLLCALCAGCSGPGSAETFADLQGGAGGVPTAEVEALGKLLQAAGVAPEQFKVLTARGGSLSKASNGFLIDGGHISAIKLSGTKLAAMDALTPLKHLKGLSLADNQIEQIAGLEHAGGLLSLDLSKNRLTSIEGLAACKTLGGLKLSNNRLQTTKGLAGAPALRTLMLDDNLLTSLPELAGHAKLTNLELSKNKLTSLEGIRELKALTVLSVADNDLTTAAGLGSLPALAELLLDRNELSTLGEFPTLPRLVHLDLSQNRLASLPASAAGIKGLLLSGNPLSAEARQAVAQAAPKCTGSSRPAKQGSRPGTIKLGCRGKLCAQSFIELRGKQQLDATRSPYAKAPFEVRISTDFGSARVVVADRAGKSMYAQAWPGRPCTLSGAKALVSQTKAKSGRRRIGRRRQPPPVKQIYLLVEPVGRRAKVVKLEIADRLPPLEEGLVAEPAPDTDAGAAEPTGDGGPTTSDAGAAGDAAPVQ